MNDQSEWERYLRLTGWLESHETMADAPAAVEEVVEQWQRLCYDSYVLRDLLWLRDASEEPADETASVLWWRLPVVEPPYCGTALDEDFPEDMTHWSPLPTPDGTEHEP